MNRYFVFDFIVLSVLPNLRESQYLFIKLTLNTHNIPPQPYIMILHFFLTIYVTYGNILLSMGC